MTEELTLVPGPSLASSPTVRDVAAIIFRQRRLFVFSFITILVAALAYGIFAPSYEAEIKIMVRRGRQDPIITSAPSSPEFAREQVTEEELNSEAELLRDQDILREVVSGAGLAMPRSWARVWIGDQAARSDRAVRRLNQALQIEPAKKATIITVHYRSSSPEKAAEVLGLLGQAYLKRHTQVRRPSGEFEFFDQQVRLAQTALAESESQLLNFDREQGIVSAAVERDHVLQQLSDAQARELQTRVELAETAQRINSLEQKIRSLPERATTEIRNSDNPELLQKLKSTLLELQLKRTSLLTKFQPSYRLVQEVDQQIAEAKQAIAVEDQVPLRDETTNLEPNRQWAKAELIKAQVEFATLAERAKATGTMLASYEQSAHQLDQQSVQQEQMLQEFKAAEDKYLLYVNKREEARISDALDQGGILNVAIAEPPVVPALPARSELSFALIGLALASTCSTALSFIADYFNPAFRTPDEVMAYLNIPVLASLPQQGI
jgi:protein tyrosine kinase modulator